MDEARSKVVLYAKLAYDNEHYTMSGWDGWDGTIEAIDRLAELFSGRRV